MPRCRAYIESLGTISAAGVGLKQLRRSLFAPSRNYLQIRRNLCERPVPVGAVNDAWLGAAHLPRTARLIDACLLQMPDLARRIAQTGAHRCAVVLGSSTSGMPEVEAAMQMRADTGKLPEDFCIRTLNLNEPAGFIADRFGIRGPVYTISNACASGAMAILSGIELLESGLSDLVIAGGVDSLSRFTTSGFAALEAVSDAPCAPFSRERRGINLGEGGTLVVLVREKTKKSFMAVAGGFETCDAHHISAPDPTGSGAQRAMLGALADAALSAAEIDLISAHGTGTVHNDQMEALAAGRIFGKNVPLASYKRLTGHTLAGAGALQAAIAAAHLTENPTGRLAANASNHPADPELPAWVLEEPRELGRPVKTVLANAFAFGGSNASIVFGAL